MIHRGADNIVAKTTTLQKSCQPLSESRIVQRPQSSGLPGASLYCFLFLRNYQFSKNVVNSKFLSVVFVFTYGRFFIQRCQPSFPRLEPSPMEASSFDAEAIR